MKILICSHCKITPAKTKGLCSACNQYEYKNGYPRPGYLFGPIKPRPNIDGICLNCGEEVRLIKKECPTCCTYRNRHEGKARPEHLWKKKAPPPVKVKSAKLCLCGEPVAHSISIKVGNPEHQHQRSETLLVCKNCYQLFMEM